MRQPAVRPAPAVDACVLCGSGRHMTVCSARDIEAQHRYLNRFHRRRLRRLAESAKEDRIDFTQDYAADIVACTSCGLIFRTPRPTSQAAIAMYAADRYASEHLQTAFQAHRNLFRTKARMLAKWLPRRKEIRIVEVGSFVCSFLAAAREAGWDVLGVDPGEQTVAFCQASGMPVHRGTMADLDLPGQSVDCIAVWNTFDQLPDPHPTLRIVQRLLRPDGVLALRIPNGACFAGAMGLTRRLPRRASAWLRAALAWNNLLTFPYLFGYSVATADRLLGRYGLQRVAVHPDTLVNLADPNLKWWALCEERLIKYACRLLARTESWRARSSYVSAPWLDLYYRNTFPAK